MTLLLAFGSTVLFIQLLRRLAPRLRLLDRPSGHKTHEGEIPLVGGIAIWLAFAVCLLFIGITEKLIYFFVAGGILVSVGATDDVTDLSPNARLLLHIVAALIMCVLGGVVVQSLGELIVPGFDVKLGLFAIPFTVFAVVALINATNMSDGLDGLCGTQVLTPLAGLAVLTGIKGDSEHFLPLMALCGALIGFLFFNLRTLWRPKATVFLGDAGSNFLGFILAWFLIDVSQGENAVLAPVAVLWFAVLLIYDTVEVVTRRLARGESPVAPNREHLHHVFELAGFSVSETTFTMATFTLIGVLIGMSTAFVAIPDNVLFAAFIVIGLVFLRMILRTWSVMRFLYRSICRRRGERRQANGQAQEWPKAADRRAGQDRRGMPRQPIKRHQRRDPDKSMGNRV